MTLHFPQPEPEPEPETIIHNCRFHGLYSVFGDGIAGAENGKGAVLHIAEGRARGLFIAALAPAGHRWQLVKDEGE